VKVKLAILILVVLLVALLLHNQATSGQTTAADRRAPEASPLVGPCCEVSFVDRSTGQVTARWKTTSRIVKFRLHSPELAARFRPGQVLDLADAGNGRVTIRMAGFEPLTGFRVRE